MWYVCGIQDFVSLFIVQLKKNVFFLGNKAYGKNSNNTKKVKKMKSLFPCTWLSSLPVAVTDF